jgi:hypothetical protein
MNIYGNQFVPPMQPPAMPPPMPIAPPAVPMPFMPPAAVPAPAAPMGIMGMMQQFYPMIKTGWEKLLEMFPKIYKTVYPLVKHAAEGFRMANPMVEAPTKEQLKDMTEDIYHKTKDTFAESEDAIEVQGGFGRHDWRDRDGAFAKDLITILLLRELLGGRRHHRWDYYRGY